MKTRGKKLVTPGVGKQDVTKKKRAAKGKKKAKNGVFLFENGRWMCLTARFFDS